MKKLIFISNIVLSFIVPTYNRPERIKSIIQKIVPFQSEEIEIVIGDDNPSFEKTYEVVKKFTDPRIKYFRNRKNLGPELNTIKIIHRAKGKFFFLLADEDDIEIETLPWILKMLKENNNITQVCGIIEYLKTYQNRDYFGIGDLNTTEYIKTYQNRVYFEFGGDRIVKQGAESLREFLFYYYHGSGLIFKKEAIDLFKALEIIRQVCLLHFLIGQVCLAGDTLCTSKTFAYTGRLVGGEKSHRPLVNRRKYWHPINRLIAEKTRIKIIYDVTESINDKNLRKYFLVKEKQRIFELLNFTLLEPIKSFLEGIRNTISNIRLSRSPRFWTEFLIEISFKFCIRKFKKSRNKFIRYVLYQFGSFLDNKIYY